MFAAFVLASLVLALTPGPAVVYVVARTLAQWRRAGFASIAGVAAGNLGNAAGASLGLAALFAVSSLAFTVVKFAGAAYLVWLGVQVLRRPAVPAATRPVPPVAPARIVRDGFFVALLNPKTALFFAAFLPQFIDPATPALGQSLAFGAVFVGIAAITDTAWVLAAGFAGAAMGRGRLVRWQALGRWVQAATYFGLGVYTAASGSRAAR